MGTAVIVLGLLVVGIPALSEERFKTFNAGKYPAHQSNADVTVGVRPYCDEKETVAAFRKVKPFKYGVLPVLVVITNNSKHLLGLENLKVRLITLNSRGLEPVPAVDLGYLQPTFSANRLPLRKGPLAKEVIVMRAFKAQVVPPKASVSGFFYYLAGREPDQIPGSVIYLSGIRDLASGQDLFYFEIPLSKCGK